MSTLPAITEELCVAVARGEHYRIRGLAMQAAAKMGAERGSRITAAFERSHAGQAPMKHWHAVEPGRRPFVTDQVLVAVDQWERELAAADRLAAAGERVLPLLLVGETRCGKTSLAADIAQRLGLLAYRLALTKAVGSYMGETANKLESAFAEAVLPGRLWLLDELDAVAFRRVGDSGAGQERAHAVGSLLTILDQLPPSTPIVATTNHVESIDSAVLGRFKVVEWPAWNELNNEQKDWFCEVHGSRVNDYAFDSYAEAVKWCRERRVREILEATNG